MMYNAKKVTMKLTRLEVCDLLIACNEAYDASGANKWEELHDKISDILAQFDEEHIDEWSK